MYATQVHSVCSTNPKSGRCFGMQIPTKFWVTIITALIQGSGECASLGLINIDDNW